MQAGRRLRFPPLRVIVLAWPWALLLLALLAVRLSKGAGFTDAYALLSRPFWPGSAQGEWVRSAQALNDQTRLRQLDEDNRRLRSLLDLQGRSDRELAAAVISRQEGGWWQQLVIGRGELQGLRPGMAVTAPGGLVGRIAGVTSTTASVTLLTDPGSRVGVWVGRVRRHGLLTGIGTSRPLLRFLEKDPGVRPGDVVVTSPASTLVPSNLTVGVIQSVDDQAMPATEAVVQLSAPVEAIDWVQVRLP
ncbi:MAG: rod shape-determining protein MreC [Cyanobacteria bacterium]|nr:rod shape-determining protein MreC [Cyanobacteriota bacterium]MDA1247314.1 rod shape-determining protein MreC [Cyanobacteriota bacterium]